MSSCFVHVFFLLKIMLIGHCAFNVMLSLLSPPEHGFHRVPQVFALLFNRYLSYADVRYHTLRTLTRLATQRAVRSSSSSGGADKNSSKEQQQQQGGGGGAQLDAEPEGEVEGVDIAGQLSAPDVARNVFDVLAAVPTTVAAAGDAGSGGGLSSWCGAAEVGREVWLLKRG
jgi:U3 small nucleolar RNA-associated protein 19